MPTISDSDWLIILATLQRQRDTTLSRAEHKRIADVIDRVEGRPSEAQLPDPYAGVYAVFNSWTRPGP